MKEIVKAVAYKLGFEIGRLPNPEKVRSARPTRTKGMILEFIGTMGVGKSHLYHLTLGISRGWFFQQHLRGITQESNRWCSILDVHEKLLTARIERIRASSADIWQQATYMHDISQVIKESLLLSTLEFPRGFALAEGLFKHCARELLELDIEETAPLWQERAFIYVRAKDPITAMQRYKQRVDWLRSLGIYQHPEADEQILKRIEADNEINDRLIDVAVELKRPVLVVFAEDDIEESVKRIADFERHLLSVR
ncbi:MAG: hypothetical protein R6V12_18930 [Candidatus Hydrogenedentota bacterium]